MLILEGREREGVREGGRDKERKLTIAAAVTIAIPEEEKKSFEIIKADEIFSVWYLNSEHCDVITCYLKATNLREA